MFKAATWLHPPLLALSNRIPDNDDNYHATSYVFDNVGGLILMMWRLSTISCAMHLPSRYLLMTLKMMPMMTSMINVTCLSAHEDAQASDEGANEE